MPVGIVEATPERFSREIHRKIFGETSGYILRDITEGILELFIEEFIKKFVEGFKEEYGKNVQMFS